jgi:hypothetical protein
MSSIQRTARKAPIRTRAATALLAVPVVAMCAKPSGMLIGHFHISQEVAATVVGLIVSGGWEVAIFFPWAIPVEATVMGLVSVFGTAAAIAW